MSIRIIQADVLAGLATLEDKSVQCVVTSPPYWGLRDYGVEGQIGLEKTPEEYVNKMVDVFREVKRVLRDDGTVWLNLGDCYASNGVYIEKYKKEHPEHQDLHTKHSERYQNRKGVRGGDYQIKGKDLIGIPWRLAFALQEDGWYIRSDIIWSKPNPMPESVTDRPTKSHEYVFLLTKKARYFYDTDAVRDEYSKTYLNDPRHITGSKEGNIKNGYSEAKAQNPKTLHRMFDKNIKSGRNRHTVWEIATQPCPEAHFATFPESLVEPCIKAGTSERGRCSVCGAPWVRVVEKESQYEKRQDRGQPAKVMPQVDSSGWKPAKVNSEIWQPSCSCKAGDPVPCVVLDPFGGSGTTAMVSRRLHRDAILIEINPSYIEIMKKRLRLNEQLFEDNRIDVITRD